MLKLIFNADDFGISHGVNKAIYCAHTKGVLNSTSIMITLKFVPEALDLIKKMPGLKIGLHGNLTNEKSVLPPSQIPLLVDENGNFKNGFVKLFILSFLHPINLKKQVKSEIKAQIDLAISKNLSLSHLDSHRHVHMIPFIFKAFIELQQEYKIPRIRFINENPLRTIKSTNTKEYLYDGGIIKNFILVGCAMINKILWKYKTDTYFYSIINTCKLSREKIKNIIISPKYKTVEIGIHPGIPEIDKKYLDDVFDDNILKEYRKKELDTLLDKSIINEFNYKK